MSIGKPERKELRLNSFRIGIMIGSVTRITKRKMPESSHVGNQDKIARNIMSS